MCPNDPPEDHPSPPLPDDIDIDLTDAGPCEAQEYMGEADSLEQLFRTQLAEFIDPAVAWLLDCVDWREVQRRMEGDTYRYLLDPRGVLRIRVPARRPPPRTT